MPTYNLPADVALLFDEIERSNSFQPLLDQASDDIEFSATIREGTPISGVFRGKAAVIRYFEEILPAVASFKQLQPQEFIISTNRALIIGDDEFTVLKNDQKFHSPYVMIMDIEKGLITKVLIIQDLSGIREAYQ